MASGGMQTVYWCTHRLLKGALGQSAGLVAVESLSGDGGQVTFTGHDLTQQQQMASIHVASVKRDHVQQFLFDGLAGSLDSQGLWKKRGTHEEVSERSCGTDHVSKCDETDSINSFFWPMLEMFFFSL